MTTATFKGFDINSLRTTAAAQPVGQQKAKYSADVVTQIGSNAIFEIRIGATVLYRSTISGALTSSASGIPFPTQFTEPPTANVANALTDANAVIVLRNASNASIEVQIPVKAGGATNFLTASAALDGTKTVRTSGLLLVPPVSLDVTTGGSGGGPPGVWTTQVLVDDMGYNDANPSAALSLGAGWGSRLYGGYTNDQYNGNATTLAPWLEICPVHDPANMPYALGTNTRVEVRKMRVYRYSGGVWNLLYLYNDIGQIYHWAWYHKDGYDTNGYSVETRMTAVAITGGYAHSLNEYRTDPHWVQHSYGGNGGSPFAITTSGSKSVPYCNQMEMRLALIDPSGTNDSANVPLLGHVAADWGGGESTVCMQGRFKRLTTDWQLFSSTNITTTKGGSTFTGALSAAALLADPPPIILPPSSMSEQ